jgi:hypothetical protein
LAVLAFAGVAAVQATPAYAAPFSMSLVGGSFGLGSQAVTSLGGSSTQCQNGLDDEFLAPFGTPDGLIDYPADPDCVNPYDNDETLPGFQAPDPVEFTGTIDGSSNFTVTSSFTPIPFTTTSPAPTAGVCDGDVLVVKITAGFSDLAPQTGNLVSGLLTLHLRLDTTLDIQCDTDLGPGQTFVPFDFDGPGGMDPWGGATPVSCAHDVSSLNTSASGDSAPASVTKTQAAGVTNPMAGKVLKPALLFGDVFDAVPLAGPDTRCGFFDTFVFGTANADNSTFQLGFMVGGSSYSDLPGIDVNVGDVTVPEGDGGLGAHGCAGVDCKNSATVVVSLSSPALVDSTVSVIADNTTGGSARGTLKGTEISAPGPADYKQTTAAKPKVLLIRAGKSTANFVIPITPDQLVEGDETIMVQVVAVSSGLVVNDGVGMVTIKDDDGGTEPDSGISIGDAAVYETGSAAVCGGVLHCKGTAVLPIVSQTPVALDTPLSYTITNGNDVVGVFSAAEAVNGKTLGDDFTPVPIAKVKTIRLGKTFIALIVTILGDNTSEPGVFSAETFTVRITGPGVKDGIGNIRILNDDT